MPQAEQRRANPGVTDIDQYLKVPKPGSWLVLVITLLLLAMTLTWAFLGTMQTTVAVTGVKDGAHFTGYLKPADSLSLAAGMPVEYADEEAGMLTGRDTTAFTAQEVKEMLDNEYFSSQLRLSEYNVTVTADLDPESCPDGVVTLEIVVAETRPFDYLMS